MDICVWLNKAENQWQSASHQFGLTVFRTSGNTPIRNFSGSLLQFRWWAHKRLISVYWQFDSIFSLALFGWAGRNVIRLSFGFGAKTVWFDLKIVVALGAWSWWLSYILNPLQCTKFSKRNFNFKTIKISCAFFIVWCYFLSLPLSHL